jgi:hypothetical protein
VITAVTAVINGLPKIAAKNGTAVSTPTYAVFGPSRRSAPRIRAMKMMGATTDSVQDAVVEDPCTRDTPGVSLAAQGISTQEHAHCL